MAGDRGGREGKGKTENVAGFGESSPPKSSLSLTFLTSNIQSVPGRWTRMLTVRARGGCLESRGSRTCPVRRAGSAGA